MALSQSARSARWLLGIAATLAIGTGLTACNKNAINDLTPDQSQVYITNYDKSVNFSQYKTFSLPDSVLVESNTGYATSLGSVESRFVSNVATALTARGFTRVAAGQKADLGVAVIRVNNRYTGVGVDPYGSYYSNYWGGGFGYGGYGGFGGYSPYYPTYYTYQVTDRYWEIQAVDLKNAPTTGTGT
ncbi:MAG: DUF4136 domain-containing protein, partial [Cytophagaceae bacterium]